MVEFFFSIFFYLDLSIDGQRFHASWPVKAAALAQAVTDGKSVKSFAIQVDIIRFIKKSPLSSRQICGRFFWYLVISFAIAVILSYTRAL